MIELIPLGAGQDVGRSCIIIKIEDKTIMLDCGVHMGFQDMRKYPDFKQLDSTIDLVLISHFHLDHCGALPYFSELIGYDGPIVMTTPTKAIFPYMLEDFRKLIIDNQGFPNEPIFSLEQLKRCLNKIQTIQLHETQVIDQITIKSYYAGHVLGACMFYIEYKGQSVVYTGDFNSSADRHLGAAWIEKCFPDVLISESTYATTYRDSKRAREMDFLHEIQTTIDQGGKVLIPVFALGRAQELCILLETYWHRMKNKVPVYFAAGMIEKAHFYYKLFVNWMNQKVQSSFVSCNMFEFKHILPFDRNMIKRYFSNQSLINGPFCNTRHVTWRSIHECFQRMVRRSKKYFDYAWILCFRYFGQQTFDWRKTSQVLFLSRLDNKDYDVKMKIISMSFSAHADCKGIMQLIKHLEPGNVVFVHGEKHKMLKLGEVVKEQTGIPVFCPANFEKIKFKIKKGVKNNVGLSCETHNNLGEKFKGYLIKDQKNQIQFVNQNNLY